MRVVVAASAALLLSGSAAQAAPLVLSQEVAERQTTKEARLTYKVMKARWKKGNWPARPTDWVVGDCNRESDRTITCDFGIFLDDDLGGEITCLHETRVMLLRNGEIERDTDFVDCD